MVTRPADCFSLIQTIKKLILFTNKKEEKMNLLTLTQSLKELAQQLVEAETQEERDKIQDKIDAIEDRIDQEEEASENRRHDWV
jgi:hypothetical protein